MNALGELANRGRWRALLRRGWLRNIYSVARSDARLHDTIVSVWVVLCCVSTKHSTLVKKIIIIF